MTKTLPRTTGPSLLHLCSCGHGAVEHPRRGDRPCRVLACHCKKFEWVPQPGCATCNHPPALHSPTTLKDNWTCKALGCRCGEWRSPRSTDAAHGNHGNDGDGDDDDDHGTCVVIMDVGEGRVTISIPSEAKRQVLISQTQTGLVEIVLSRPTRTRRVSITHADRSG
jgi:hypothetical protein